MNALHFGSSQNSNTATPISIPQGGTIRAIDMELIVILNGATTGQLYSFAALMVGNVASFALGTFVPVATNVIGFVSVAWNRIAATDPNSDLSKSKFLNGLSIRIPQRGFVTLYLFPSTVTLAVAEVTIYMD